MDLRAKSFTNRAQLHATFPEFGLFLSYCSMCINFTPLSEWMGNFCKTQGFTPETFSANYIIYFSQFWVEKGFAIFCWYSLMLVRLHIESLPKPFQQSTEIYITALFRICFTSPAIKHMMCLAPKVLLIHQPGLIPLTPSEYAAQLEVKCKNDWDGLAANDVCMS